MTFGSTCKVKHWPNFFVFVFLTCLVILKDKHVNIGKVGGGSPHLIFGEMEATKIKENDYGLY